ncbi:ribonuclease H-like domain-containing protein [Tanacetum coccineum]
MTNHDQPSAPPTLTLVEKLYAVHNINTLVPEKLDLAEPNYSTWSYFFKGHCSNFGVLKHIEGSSTHSSTSIPPMYDWIIADSIVKSWIFLTLSSTLRKRLIKANPKTAKDAWETIEAIFEDNKRTRVVSLKGELPKTTLTYAINGLSDKYGSLAQIIAHKEPFPDLFTVRSMVFTEEMRIQNKSPSLSVSTNSSAPQVLLTETPHCVQDTGTNKERGTRSNSSQNNTRTTTSNMHTGIGFGNRGLDLAAQQQLLSLLQAQNTLLAQYGLSTISIPRTPIRFNNSGQRIVPAQPSAQQLMTHGLTPNQQALFTYAVQNTGNTSSNIGQEMVLPIAFNTMTLQDPANANWHMDTGASSHLNSCAHNLSTIFNSRMYPSVLVGDWKSIPVTNTGHSTLPTPSPPLHLNNVLVTPNIVKILICVCQFVRENKCTIKFDEFGFSVKDFRTCQILLRCDSTDLWTSPITSVLAIKYYVLFLDHFSHYLWVYPLRNKSDALSKFIHFRAYVKNQFKTDIKSLQCDHGGEFDNNALHQLFASNGITIRFSCPKTSQQNGKSERMIRTINNLIRTLLFQAHLPPTFWVEALHMAAYLLNLLPSNAINNEIPHTRLFKTQPNYADLRVFGCLCYPYINTNHKLEPRATPAIFLGYPTNHRGYRCLDLNTDKIILSRHVTFDETVFPYGSMTPNEPPSYTFLDASPNIIQQHLLTKLISSSSPNTTTQSTPNNNPPSNTTPHQISSPTQPTIHDPLPNLQLNRNSPSQPASTHSIPAVTTNTNPKPASTHSMVTRYHVGTNRPTQSYTLNVLVPRPPDVNIVRSLWLFRHKHNADGSLNRYKARLVANGSTQIVGIDVDETFSPVVKPATIRTVLSLAISRHWPVHQLDVKNAFLHGSLSETVYMHQPPGFRDPRHPDHVCLLQRSLYGLKQAPRAWFQRFAAYAARVGFLHSRCDSSLFIYRQGSDTAYLLLYVDDIVLTASSTALLQRIIASLHAEFSMTDLGPLNYFLGVSVTRNTSGMFLSQQKYATEVLERAGMLTCNPCRTPVDTDSKLAAAGDPVSDPTLYRRLAGALQYLTFTRPDISYAVQQVCLFMHDPREPHFSALKRILRYVRGTLTSGLQLYSSTTSSLVAYSDADWAGCPTTRRSTSGYCVFLGNNLLSWSSKRQFTLSRSSAEAEYRGVANAVAETCWLRNLLRELHTPLSTATIVYCDNVSAVYLSSNPVQHQRTKHIEIDIHFVRDLVTTGHIRVLHVPSRYQYADIFTKGLPTALFDEFRDSLSVRSSPAQTAGGC